MIPALINTQPHTLSSITWDWPRVVWVEQQTYLATPSSFVFSAGGVVMTVSGVLADRIYSGGFEK